MAFDVYNYDPRHGEGTPPSGGLKIEVLPMDNASQLSASDFYNQLTQQPGFTPCPAATTRPMTIGGHDALEVSCPAQNSDVFYVPDGRTMLAASESISLNGKPSDVLTHMVTSLQFNSQAAK
jgi:hypothetical protein